MRAGPGNSASSLSELLICRSRMPDGITLLPGGKRGAAAFNRANGGTHKGRSLAAIRSQRGWVPFLRQGRRDDDEETAKRENPTLKKRGWGTRKSQSAIKDSGADYRSSAGRSAGA